MEGTAQELLSAARQGDTEVLTRLLEAGAPVDCTDEEGRTPLMLAVRGDHFNALRLLLSYGADVDRQDFHGTTALMYAVEKEEAAFVGELLEACARVDLRRADGEDARSLATRLGRSDSLKLLEDAVPLLGEPQAPSLRPRSPQR